MAKINFKKVTERLKSAGVMAAGSVVSNQLAGGINKMLGAQANPKLTAGIGLAVGALLPGFLGESNKAGFITDLSNGMMSESAVRLAKALGVPGVSGTDEGDPINGLGAYIEGTDAGDSVNGLSN